MKIELTPTERQELKELHRSIKTRRDADKIKAIVMIADGYLIEEVSQVLFLDKSTILRWKRRFLKRSTMENWLYNKFVSYDGKLSKEEEKRLEKYLIKKMISDSKQVIFYIKREFGKRYSKSGVVSLLHRLGFTYKQTKLIPSKYNPEAQNKFNQEYEKMNKNIKPEEVILFGDGVHPQHNTAIAKAWIKVGSDKEIKSNTGRTRININGAYNPNNQDIIQFECKTINAETTIEYFKKIEKFYPNKQKIYLILDNARSNRNKLVTEYIKTSRIDIVFLPPYSPNLNLIERLWKHMRKKVINNRYYEKFTDFKKALVNYFEKQSSKHQRKILRQFIGTKLHLFAH